MTTFARAVHSSSNSVVLWVSSSARQTDLQLAEHLQAKFFMFSRTWMLPNCTRKMGTGDYLCIAMSGGAPWGFRLQGGKEQKQPLQIAKVRAWQKGVVGVLWAQMTGPLCLNPSYFQENGWYGSCCDACLNLLTCFAEILQMLILSVSIKRDYYFWVACKCYKGFVRCWMFHLWHDMCLSDPVCFALWLWVHSAHRKTQSHFRKCCFSHLFMTVFLLWS